MQLAQVLVVPQLPTSMVLFSILCQLQLKNGLMRSMMFMPASTMPEAGKSIIKKSMLILNLKMNAVNDDFHIEEDPKISGNNF